MKDILYIVIPCYNEEDVLKETSKVLKNKLEALIKDGCINKKSKVLYVNDGSIDKTWDLIKEIHSSDSIFTGINLSRNVGHQNALYAGLMVAKEDADFVVSMDADLQDDISAIDKMIQNYYDGCDIVYGVRNNRKKDTLFKRRTAQFYYKFMKFIGVEIIYNHADYRLSSKRVLNQLENYKEVNLFLRGIYPTLGYQSSIVYYERQERFAGKSKYPLKKMLSFAWNGITSFSIKPIKLVLNIGVIIFVLSMITIIYSIIRKIMGATVSGWTFIVCSIWFVAGLQMLSLGIIGEYIGKIYSESKARPRYIITDQLDKKKK